MEEHADGGKHYHLAILFSGSPRWLAIKNAVQQAHGISLHFASQQLTDVLHSMDHPKLGNVS